VRLDVPLGAILEAHRLGVGELRLAALGAVPDRLLGVDAVMHQLARPVRPLARIRQTEGRIRPEPDLAGVAAQHVAKYPGAGALGIDAQV